MEDIRSLNTADNKDNIISDSKSSFSDTSCWQIIENEDGNDESRLLKNRQIADTMKNTLERHSRMDCKTYEVKVIGNKLNKTHREYINGIFREAKWIRNAFISNKDSVKTNIKEVPVKVKDKTEIRTLEYIGSQMKQSVIRQISSEIKSLSSNKKQGRKTGRLKYKSVCNAINLKQYGNTYSIDFDHNRIRVQNIKKPLYVRGLKQIPDEAEICNAKMVRKASGLYFYITCYVSKKEYIPTDKEVGIDFGIEHNLTLSDGNIFDIFVKESKMIKRLSKKINRSWIRNGRTNSNNNLKRIALLKKEYEHLHHQRKDKANNIVHDILNDYDFIAIQDEMIHNWHSGLFGKQVQNSAMGLIKAKLKNSSKTFVVDRSFPSTQICPVCGCLTKHPLSERKYKCVHCGYEHPSRDIKSAQSILDEALKQVSMEHRTQSPGEIESSTVADLSAHGKICAMTQEAQVL